MKRILFAGACLCAALFVVSSSAGPRSASANSITIQHVFPAAGKFTFRHNLGTLFPGQTCYVSLGKDVDGSRIAGFTVPGIPLDANNVEIQAIEPMVVRCTFTSSDMVENQ